MSWVRFSLPRFLGSACGAVQLSSGMSRGIRTHWSGLSKDSDDEYGFEDVESDETNEWEEQAEDVECYTPMILARQTRVEVACPAESRVQSDVAGADEENERRTQEQPDGDGRAVVEELEANESIQEEDPARRRNGRYMDGRKSLDRNVRTLDPRVICTPEPTFRTASSSGNPPIVNISQICITMKPIRNICISLLSSMVSIHCMIAKPHSNCIFSMRTFVPPQPSSSLISIIEKLRRLLR